jgi:hypothetical protein
MRSLTNLDIEKSIQTKKLIFEESWGSKFETLFMYFFFLVFIYYSLSCLITIKRSANSDLENFIAIGGLIFSIYFVYCKFTEKHLKEIKFNIHREEAKQRILEYGKKYHFRISKISANLIFLNEPISSLSFWGEERTTIIFFRGQSIFYTLIKNGTKINSPVLFSQHLMRRDLKKIVNQAKFDLHPKRSYFDGFFNDLS